MRSEGIVEEALFSIEILRLGVGVMDELGVCIETTMAWCFIPSYIALAQLGWHWTVLGLSRRANSQHDIGCLMVPPATQRRYASINDSFS